MHTDSGAILSYLQSLDCLGAPTQKELDCLERIKTWEHLIGWCAEMEGVGGGDLTAAMALPAELSPEVDCQVSHTKSKKTSGYDPKTMSRAVARDLGLI